MKKMIASALLGLSLIITGCGTDTDEKSEEKNSTAEPQSESVTVDNDGREITVNEVPSKVLTLGPNTTELFIALGLADKIIGNSLNNHSRAPLPEYEEEYNKIPELTYGSATREAVTTSGADFIYGIDWEFGSEGLDIEELESLGITTYMNNATTFDEMYKEILDIGKIFQVEEAAEAFVADQKERIAAVQEKTSSVEPVDVLIYDSGGDGVFTTGGSNFATLLIEAAGGRNVFDDIADKAWTTVSYEEVVARQPDVLLIQDYDVPSLEQKIEDIKNSPALAELECVKNERFVINSLETILPGSRMAYAVETLAEGFHPELFE